jgi:hypothetical protein
MPPPTLPPCRQASVVAVGERIVVVVVVGGGGGGGGDDGGGGNGDVDGLEFCCCGSHWMNVCSCQHYDCRIYSWAFLHSHSLRRKLFKFGKRGNMNRGKRGRGALLQ